MKIITDNLFRSKLSLVLLFLLSTLALSFSNIYSANSEIAREIEHEPARSIAADILRRAIEENNLSLLQSLVRDFNAGRTDPFFCFRGTMAPFGHARLDAAGRPLSDPLDYARVYAPALVPTLIAARVTADEYARDAVLLSRTRTRRANPQEAL